MARKIKDATSVPTVDDHRIGEVIKNSTAPLAVNDQLNKLCRRYGTARVFSAVKSWVAFIDVASAVGKDDSE